MSSSDAALDYRQITFFKDVLRLASYTFLYRQGNRRLLFVRFYVEPSTGFEPALSAWKAEVLPLHHDGIKIARTVSCSGYLIQLFRAFLCGLRFSLRRSPDEPIHYARRPISWIISLILSRSSRVSALDIMSCSSSFSLVMQSCREAFMSRLLSGDRVER